MRGRAAAGARALTDDRVVCAAVLDEDNGRQRPHLEFFGDKRRALGVDAQELGLDVLGRQRAQVRVDNVAAPVGAAVKVHHGARHALELLKKLLLVGHVAQLAVARRRPRRLLRRHAPQTRQPRRTQPLDLVLLGRRVQRGQLLVQVFFHALQRAQQRRADGRARRAAGHASARHRHAVWRHGPEIEKTVKRLPPHAASAKHAPGGKTT